MSNSGIVIKGFLRVQLLDKKTGKIIGDSGYVQNKATNEGLTNFARFIAAQAGSYVVGYAAIGTQTAAVNVTQTDVIGRENAFKAVNVSTSGTCTATFTCSYDGSNNSAAINVGAAGLFKTDSAGSMVACQTFTTSNFSTNQNMNLTYQLRFATST